MTMREEEIDRFVEHIADAMRAGAFDAMIDRIDQLLDTANNEDFGIPDDRPFLSVTFGLELCLTEGRKMRGDS